MIEVWKELKWRYHQHQYQYVWLARGGAPGKQVVVKILTTVTTKNFLQLNSANTKFLLVGTKSALSKQSIVSPLLPPRWRVSSSIAPYHFSLPSIILPGLLLSNYTLTIDTLGSLTEPTDSLLIHSLVTSCFDDCNPLLFGLPHTNHKPLLVYNLATTRMPSFHHISPQSCSNPTGSQSDSEDNWKSFRIHLRPLVTLPLLLTQILSLHPPGCAPHLPQHQEEARFQSPSCHNSGPLSRHPNNVTSALYCVFIGYVVRVYL